MINSWVGVIHTHNAVALLLDFLRGHPRAVNELCWVLAQFGYICPNVLALRVDPLAVRDGMVVLYWARDEGRARAAHPASTAYTGLKVKHEGLKGILSVLPAQPQIPTSQKGCNGLPARRERERETHTNIKTLHVEVLCNLSKKNNTKT